MSKLPSTVTCTITTPEGWTHPADNQIKRSDGWLVLWVQPGAFWTAQRPSGHYLYDHMGQMRRFNAPEEAMEFIERFYPTPAFTARRRSRTKK